MAEEEEQHIQPIEATGGDPEIDHMVTQNEILQEFEEKPERKLSDSFVEFVEKIGEGARRLSEHVHEDGAAVADYFGGK